MNSYANDWTRYLSNITLLPKSPDISRGISLFPWLAFIASLSLSLFFPIIVEARPEFATELEKECSFCHLDPAGGGPRNRVGEIFEENYFEFPEDFDMEAVTEEVKGGRQTTHNLL